MDHGNWYVVFLNPMKMSNLNIPPLNRAMNALITSVSKGYFYTLLRLRSKNIELILAFRVRTKSKAECCLS